MATRSGIGVKREDWSVVGVYCHSDGYPEGVGRMLQEHYLDRAKVEKLVALGSISSLGSEIGERHPFNERRDDWTTFYGRDRGESGTEPKTFGDRELFREDIRRSGVEFVYVLTWGGWMVAKPFGRWRELPDVLAGGVELLVEPDPDRGPDVVIENCDGGKFPAAGVISGSTLSGRQWVEDRLPALDVFPQLRGGELWILGSDHMLTVVEAARHDGIVVDQIERSVVEEDRS